MPKVIYKCELCDEEFDTKSEAAMCEMGHSAICANPRCGVVFVRIPQSKLYCSERCQSIAKSQRQRDKKQNKSSHM